MPEIAPEWEECILEDLQITEELILKKLLLLNVCKSMGPDGVHPRVLKEAATVLVKPLTLLFKKSLETQKVPQQWKLAHVTPIFKKGSKEDPQHYRPISLTQWFPNFFLSFPPAPSSTIQISPFMCMRERVVKTHLRLYTNLFFICTNILNI